MVQEALAASTTQLVRLGPSWRTSPTLAKLTPDDDVEVYLEILEEREKRGTIVCT